MLFLQSTNILLITSLAGIALAAPVSHLVSRAEDGTLQPTDASLETRGALGWGSSPDSSALLKPTRYSFDARDSPDSDFPLDDDELSHTLEQRSHAKRTLTAAQEAQIKAEVTTFSELAQEAVKARKQQSSSSLSFAASGRTITGQTKSAQGTSAEDAIKRLIKNNPALRFTYIVPVGDDESAPIVSVSRSFSSQSGFISPSGPVIEKLNSKIGAPTPHTQASSKQKLPAVPEEEDEVAGDEGERSSRKSSSTASTISTDKFPLRISDSEGEESDGDGPESSHGQVSPASHGARP